MRVRRAWLRTRALLIAGLLAAAFPLAAAKPKAPPAPSNDDCLTCHGDPETKRADGRPLNFAKTAFDESIHGQAGLSCVDCHADLAQVTDFPHAESLAKVRCASCHDDEGRKYAEGIHAKARRESRDSPAATCSDCHGTHDILPASNPKSRTHHLNLAATCSRCHGNAETIARGHIGIGNVAALFKDSIHGRALEKLGLNVAPNCGTCHGHHDIRRASDPQSPVNRENIPATCGACHEGIKEKYEASIHWAEHKRGNPRAAVCIDCHSAHDIKQVDVPAWRLDVIKECGTCHEQSLRTYRDGFHGKATNLGFTRVATCSDCHGPHEILAANDPRSPVAPQNRARTCGKCHTGASASFALYDPHADPEKKARGAILYYTSMFMKLLLAGVFAFFGLHTALWFPRSLRARQKLRAEHTPGGPDAHA
jgi:nitrate/TMAO reductase-like tetraheme cytochrome c subunit